MAIDEFEVFKKNIQGKIGLDLNKYKERQLKRRILQFMSRYNTTSFPVFLKVLDANPSDLEKFKNFITINTSEFFRDIKLYDYIKKQIIADYSKKFASVKFWSAGCSIGAEPYSIAILAQEANIRNYAILASDFDRVILGKAREGIYTANLLKNVPKDILQKYFVAKGDKYHIDSSLKGKIVFKEHNLLKDAYPSDQDVILCRNVFIYFTQEVQQDLIASFTKSLKPGGYFIIGSSEFIPAPETFGLKKAFFSVYQKL